MVELYQRVPDILRMPGESSLSVVVPHFEGENDVMNFGYCSITNLFEDIVKVVEGVVKKRFC